MLDMSHVDFGRYKRIVQYFWDPEPKNNDGSKSPIWCLGKEYDLQPKPTEAHILLARESNQDKTTICNGDGSCQAPKKTKLASPNSEQGESPQVHAYGDDGDQGWPKDFLDDFESRLWFTYRSSFSAIEKSPNPKTSNSTGLAVRLRSQLVDHGGFTSDTGWGCMIRSGQSLLANALLVLRLGRGMKS